MNNEVRNPIIDFVNAQEWKNNRNELITIDCLILEKEEYFTSDYKYSKNSTMQINEIDITSIEYFQGQNEKTIYKITANNNLNIFIDLLQYEILIEYLKPIDLSINTYQKFLEETSK